MNQLEVNLSEVVANPGLFTQIVRLNSSEEMVFRPLLNSDVSKLAVFLNGLSEETRRLSTFPGYDLATAKELCDAINKYDKLRFIVESGSGQIVGLLEFSFGFPENDILRFKKYSFEINKQTDCRFGPTLADSYQNKGIGSLIFHYIINIAQKFGRSRIILYGGVLADNSRAIHFYEKHGFKKIGSFINSDGKEALDMILIL